MKALNGWVGRYSAACEEIRRLEHQVQRWGTAFGVMLPLLSDEQLTALDTVLHAGDVEQITTGARASCSCAPSGQPVP